MRPDPFETYVRGLRLSHLALLRNLERFVSMGDGAQRATSALPAFVALFRDFLEVHHDAEEHFVFPALRAHGQGRSSDAAALDRLDRDHREIERLGRRLEGGAVRELGTISAALHAVLSEHVVAEEAVMTREHLAEMIGASEFATVLAEIQRANRKNALAMAGFLLGSLGDDEQRALMGDAPWLFRKLIIPLLVMPRMRRFHGLVYSSEVSL